MAEHSFSHLMLIAESTPEGMSAARVAIGLAVDMNAALCVASHFDTTTLRQLLTYKIFVHEEMEEYERELEKSARRQIDYIVALAAQGNIKANGVLMRGVLHTVTVAQTRECKADLLVMGAFRTSMVKTDLIAREKELIIEEAPCAVLLVPAHAKAAGTHHQATSNGRAGNHNSEGSDKKTAEG